MIYKKDETMYLVIIKHSQDIKVIPESDVHHYVDPKIYSLLRIDKVQPIEAKIELTAH